MNPVKKIFCRIYQLAFRAAMPFLPYREPEKLHCVEDIGPLIKKLGMDTVLLVTDGFLRKSGATYNLEKSLENSNIKCVVYDKTNANPTVGNVEEALDIYKSGGCECLIAYGGGSSMDCAKAVGARVAYPQKSLNRLGGTLHVLRKIPVLIAVPTTAGTGSEVTVTAVITDSETKHKYTMNDFPLIPAYAVLDPKVTYTLPQSLTATTGMDALTHAVEAYIGNSTTKETRRLAKEAVRLIFENIEIAYNDGNNNSARKNMLNAAYMAGIAFSKSYVGYIHAVAHSLGGQYNVPHGLANSVLMPIVLEEYGECVHKKLRDLAVSAGLSKETDSPKDAAERFIYEIRNLNKRMGIPETIEGICREDISKMARYASKEANPLYPVPRLMDASELEKLYYKVSKESVTE
ncbi:MAG: iron-containing alcohol dehydrogenase [Clostridia bacterium]|nr:iron-containing alcohol dehydrogenase [Clostridia bacterium]